MNVPCAGGGDSSNKIIKLVSYRIAVACVPETGPAG